MKDIILISSDESSTFGVRGRALGNVTAELSDTHKVIAAGLETLIKESQIDVAAHRKISKPSRTSNVHAYK